MPITHTHELDSTPNLTVLFGKAVLTGFTRNGSTLPSTVYSRSPLAIDPGHLSAYTKVCGFRLTDQLPITYPHILGFPLQVKLMTDNDFPFPLVGSVHIANRITQLRPLYTTDALQLQVHVENLRDHPKGHQFDMITSVSVDDTLAWHSTSTYLRRTGSGGSSGASEVVVRQPRAIWRVPDDIGRRYADVSGDRNPIHLHPLTAKLFGFPRAIAHGMWTKARCLAAFEGRLPEAYTVDVKFKLPVLLPAKVGFATNRAEGTWTFDLFDARTGKPHLTGEIT
ncbi:MaoC like domain-containing protein [Kibdelosporangium aridum]|uniref:MaoC like domain-containing protein n=1 Tax=Kibdelosporangium aridum TaxID=2030 RepID=A0A1W2DDA0_KIBAR|nr:MaoC/PaaZ C-terminal domain-containing protein [Kibdelosporangium aridum]SMC95383.1 MaoC like domain-containing protein [Kibdelosporangium aridum]